MNIERNYEVGHTTLELGISTSNALRLKLQTAVGAKDLPQQTPIQILDLGLLDLPQSAVLYIKL